MGTVRIQTHWTVRDRLEEIPKAEWRDIVLTKGRWIKDAIDYRLGAALELLDEIEHHEGWKAAEMDRDNFLRFVCFIEPEDLPRIREGYRIMRSRGQEVSSRDEAVAALATPGGDHRSQEFQEIRELRMPGGDRKNQGDTITLIRGSTGKPYLLARLDRALEGGKERPEYRELAARVRDGELSANAAAIQAGFRQKTITIPIDSGRAAEIIKRHFDKRRLVALIEKLKES